MPTTGKNGYFGDCHTAVIPKDLEMAVDQTLSDIIPCVGIPTMLQRLLDAPYDLIRWQAVRYLWFYHCLPPLSVCPD